MAVDTTDVRGPDSATEVCALCAQPSIHCLQARRNEQDLTALVLDIHDGLVQNLFAAYAQIHMLRRAVEDIGPPDVEGLQEGLNRVALLLESSLGEIRTFVRAFGPDEAHNQDLRRMVEDLAAQRRELTGMDVRVHVDGDFPTPPLAIRVALYRILQEALANAYRHAHATRVDVHLYRRGPILGLRVRDNGRGFDVDAVLASPTTGGHLGLRGVRERVQTLGGKFEVTSVPGRGTVLQVELPSYEK